MEEFEKDFGSFVEFLLPLMKKNIGSTDSLLPIGCSMDLSGKLKLHAHAPENLPHDGGESIILTIMRKFAKEGWLRACALGYSCQITIPKSGR